MRHLHRRAAAVAFAAGSLLLGGCTTTLVVAHLVDKLTEGDRLPLPPRQRRARAAARCGAYRPGSLKAEDARVRPAGLPADAGRARPGLWPMRCWSWSTRGASPEACTAAPWVALAQANPCPDFAAASPREREALRWLAEADSLRAIHHDVVQVR